LSDIGSGPLSDGVKIRLSCLLLRPSVDDPRQAVAKTAGQHGTVQWYATNGLGGFSPIAPDGLRAAAACLLLRSELAAPQPWQMLLAEYLRVEGFEAQPRHSTGAVLFMRMPIADGVQRLVAWTFGAGHHLVDSNAADPRFGLLAVLNRLSSSDDPDAQQPRGRRRAGVTKALVNTRSGHLRRAELTAALPTRADRLGRIDTTADALASVTGLASGSNLSRLTGGRSMQEDAQVSSLDDLRRLAERAVASYGETHYQAEYAWIDRTVPEEDQAVIDCVLEGVWNGRTPDGRPVAVDIVWGDQIRETEDDPPVDHYRYQNEHRRKTKDFRTTLTWMGVRNHLKPLIDQGHRISEAFEEPLRFFDERDAQIGSCKVLELITAEAVLDGRCYVLADGTVWRINQEFLDAVDDDLRRYLQSTQLPIYHGGNEDAYNRSVVGDSLWSDRAILLDKHLIALPGQSPFEPCDILVADGTLIHAKLKGRSSTLSHLCEQAVVSARLLRRERRARERLQELIIETCHDDALATAMMNRVDDLANSSHGWKVLFAIVGSWREKALTGLPMFARIALRDACQWVADLGFDPAIELASSTAD
jgi:uncharacterized protein (TIGR04141 family)